MAFLSQLVPVSSWVSLASGSAQRLEIAEWPKRPPREQLGKSWEGSRRGDSLWHKESPGWTADRRGPSHPARRLSAGPVGALLGGFTPPAASFPSTVTTDVRSEPPRRAGWKLVPQS